MPGLSNDPAKAAKQRAGLHAGRRALAMRTLGLTEAQLRQLGIDPESAPAAPAASAPTPPIPGQMSMGESDGGAAGAAGADLGLPVHTYGAPPAPQREPEPAPAPVPVAEDPSHADLNSRKPRGPLGRLVDGFAHG